VNNQQKTIGIEKKLDVISILEKGEQIIEISQNITFAFSRVCTIHDNIERIKKVSNVEITSNADNLKHSMFVHVTRLP